MGSKVILSTIVTLACTASLMVSAATASTASVENLVLTAKDITKDKGYKITRTAYASDGTVLFEKTTPAPEGSLLAFEVMEIERAEKQGLRYLDYAGDEPSESERARLADSITTPVRMNHFLSERLIIDQIRTYDPEYVTTSGSFGTAGANAKYTIYWSYQSTFDYLIDYVKYNLDAQPTKPIYFSDMILEGAGRSFNDNGTCPQSPVAPSYKTYTLSWFGNHGNKFKMFLNDTSNCSTLWGMDYMGYVTM